MGARVDEAVGADAVCASAADRVTAIVTTYNSADVIGAALRSVPVGVRCIVIDNASRDETRTAAAEARRGVEIVTMGANLGFGRACNAGLRLVETEYGVLINPDVVLSEGCLDLCVAVADAHQDVALFGMPPHKAKAVESDLKSGDVRPVEMVIGAFMFMRMAAFEEIGFFDENIFLYFEDDDLCLRTRMAGYGVAAVDGIEIEHPVDASTAPQFDNWLEKQRIFGQSCAYFAAKHESMPEGRKAARKAARFRWKSYRKALKMDFAAARGKRARLRGFEEFRRFGTKVMFDNAFARART